MTAETTTEAAETCRTLPAVAERTAIAAAARVDRNPAAVYLARLALGSRRAMAAALQTIAALAGGAEATAETFPWERLGYQHTQSIRTALADRYAIATANRHLAALRGVLREAWRLGLMTAEEHQRAADLEAVRGETLPAGRELSDGELRALFAVCAEDQGAAGARDAALLAVLYGGGLRRSEAVALDLADFTLETGALTVRAGKGKKARLVYAKNGSNAALMGWLEARGSEPGALLCPVDKAGRVVVRRMTDQAVLYILQRRADEARVSAFTPHDLRRTFISHLLGAGADIATVQRLAGHANVGTTARYDRRGEEAKQRAAELLHVPYVRGRCATNAPTHGRRPLRT
jgi:site-specific recombinase XerD